MPSGLLSLWLECESKQKEEKEISPRIIKERGKLMKIKVRNSHAMTDSGNIVNGWEMPGPHEQ